MAAMTSAVHAVDRRRLTASRSIQSTGCTSLLGVKSFQASNFILAINDTTIITTNLCFAAAILCQCNDDFSWYSWLYYCGLRCIATKNMLMIGACRCIPRYKIHIKTKFMVEKRDCKRLKYTRQVTFIRPSIINWPVHSS